MTQLLYLIALLLPCLLFSNPKDIFYSLSHPYLSPVRSVDRLELLFCGKKAHETIRQLLGWETETSFTLDDDVSTIDLFSLEYHQGKVEKALTPILKAQAKAGKKVRIAISKPSISNISKRDDQILRSIASAGAKLEYFQNNSSNLVENVNMINHAKVLLIQKQFNKDLQLAKQGTLVVGGRNLGDNFYFEKWDSKLPNLICYQDVELIVSSPYLASDAYQLLNAFWEREENIMKAPIFISEENGIGDPADPFTVNGHEKARFFMSYPFAGKQATSFMEVILPLIESAKSSIVLFSPYHAPTDAFTKAIARALERGVQVTIVSNQTMDLSNKPSDNMVYQYFLNIYQNLPLNLYVWSDDASFMHAKMATFDDEVSYVGGANFNYRSAYQDIESGCLILSKTLNEEIKEILQSITPKLKPFEFIPISAFDKAKIGVLRPFY